MRLVPVLHSQRTGQSGSRRDPLPRMQVREIEKLAVIEIAVVGAVVGAKGPAGQGS